MSAVPALVMKNISPAPAVCVASATVFATLVLLVESTRLYLLWVCFTASRGSRPFWSTAHERLLSISPRLMS